MARPRTPLTDRTSAVRTALEMIDEDGLAKFSIERLGKRLGVRGPSLYHHFTDRADLLAQVAKLVFLEMPGPPHPDDVSVDTPWDEQMLELTLAFWRALMRHPNAIPLVVEHFPRLEVLPHYERLATTLGRAEVPADVHLLLFEGLEKLTLGSASYWAAAQAESTRSGIEQFVDVRKDEYPAIDRALKASADQHGEALFRATCTAYLAGVKRLSVSAD